MLQNMDIENVSY